MTDAALTRWALAQDSVLGACLLSQRAVTTVLSQTTAEMFDEQHRPLYLAISATFAAGERVDPVTVSGRMPESSELRGYMMQLMEVTPTAAGATDYVRQLRELHRLRQVQELGQKLADAQQMEDVSELMGQLTGLMTVRQEARVFSFEAAAGLSGLGTTDAGQAADRAAGELCPPGRLSFRRQDCVGAAVRGPAGPAGAEDRDF